MRDDRQAGSRFSGRTHPLGPGTGEVVGERLEAVDGRVRGSPSRTGPSRPAKRTARPPPRRRFRPEALPLSPPNGPRPEHPIERQAQRPESDSLPGVPEARAVARVAYAVTGC